MKNKWHYKIINNLCSGIFWGIKSRLRGDKYSIQSIDTADE